MGSTSPTVFSESPELLRGLGFLFSLLVSVWPGEKVLEACPAIPGGWGSPHPGKLKRRNLDFSLGSSVLNSPQGFISFQPSLVGQAALAVGALHSRSEKKPLPFSPRLGKLDHTGMAPCPPPTTRKLAWLATGWVGRKAELSERVPRYRTRGGRRQG